MTVSVATVPVMEGYRALAPDKVRIRRKRLALTALFVVTFFYAAIFSIFPRAFSLILVLPIVAIYLVTVWALPVLDYTPPKLFGWLFWGFFVSLMIWPRYLAVAIPGLPWITMDRLFGGPLLLLLLVLTSSSKVFRETLRPMLAHSRAITLFLSLFAVNICISNVMTPNPFTVLNALISMQMSLIAIFFVSLYVFRNARSLHLFIVLFVILIAVNAGIAIEEARQQRVLWANHIPGFLSVEDPVVQRILEGSFRLGAKYRAVGTSTTPLSLAEMFALSSPFICYLFVETRRLAFRVLLAMLDIAVLIAIIATDSRLGYGGFLVGHAAYLAYLAQKHRQKNPNSILNVALAGLIPIGAILFITAIFTVGRLRNSVLGGSRTQSSNDARAEQWRSGLNAIWDSPIIGFGIGSGGWKLGYTNGAGVVTIDSFYLSTLLDFGFVGFILFYGMIVMGTYQGARLAFKGNDRVHHLSAVFAIFLFIFLLTKAVLSQPTNHPLIFIALGAVVVLRYLHKQGSSAIRPAGTQLQPI